MPSSFLNLLGYQQSFGFYSAKLSQLLNLLVRLCVCIRTVKKKHAVLQSVNLPQKIKFQKL